MLIITFYIHKVVTVGRYRNAGGCGMYAVGISSFKVRNMVEYICRRAMNGFEWGILLFMRHDRFEWYFEGVSLFYEVVLGLRLR